MPSQKKIFIYYFIKWISKNLICFANGCPGFRYIPIHWNPIFTFNFRNFRRKTNTFKHHPTLSVMPAKKNFSGLPWPNHGMPLRRPNPTFLDICSLKKRKRKNCLGHLCWLMSSLANWQYIIKCSCPYKNLTSTRQLSFLKLKFSINHNCLKKFTNEVVVMLLIKLTLKSLLIKGFWISDYNWTKTNEKRNVDAIKS